MVVGADVELTRWSKDNPFCKNLRKGIANKAKTDGALNVANEDHSFLMEFTLQRTVLYYTDFIYGFFWEMEGKLVAKEELGTTDEVVDEMSDKEN